MTDIQVDMDLHGQMRPVGLLRLHQTRRLESVTFEYDSTWLSSPDSFALEPALPLSAGIHPPPSNRFYGSLGDSAPDTWGRRLMQRTERRRAETAGQTPRTLTETDYLLGVSDVARLGALRFRRQGESDYLAQPGQGVPAFIELGRLLQATENVVRGEETDEDLELIFAPGSSLGGARPKASVMDQHGNLSIAKFPKETDDYSIETWEEIALQLAERAGIKTPVHQLVQVAGKPVLLSRRFDREPGRRIPFMSALAMLGMADGQSGCYPDLADAMAQVGDNAKDEIKTLFRRMVFNVLISNVDDHLRNHGFLWYGRQGWRLSPAYDLNPVPTDVRARILSTNIDLDEATCSLDVIEGATGYYNLNLKEARTIINEVAQAVSGWRGVARRVGVRASEINRMASAFDHDDLQRALGL